MEEGDYSAVGNLLREVKFVEGSLTGEDPPGMLITDYRYDSLYRLTKVKTPEGNEAKLIRYSYDKFGRQSQRITPDAGQTDYIYDRNNNMTYTQDANQRDIDPFKFTFRSYDALNRLTGIGENIFQPSDDPNDGNQFEPSDPQYYLTLNVYDTITNSIVNIFTPPGGYYDLPNYTKGRLAATAFRTRQTDIWIYKYYRYDERGRVKTMWQMIDGLDVKTVSHEYNSQDQIAALIYNSGIDFKRYRYRYDNAGRLQAVDTYEGPESSDDPSYYQSFADYEYNPNSFIVTQNFIGGFTGTTLGYDNRGRISSYYSHNSEFIYSLSYLRNSNVLQQELYGSYRDYFANTEDLVYKFTYDKSNRLLSATNTAGSSNEYKIENTYDKDGNILTLKRYGDGGVMQDDFAYQYYSGTNKLRKVTGSADQYQYDLNGNVTTDSLNKNTSAVYDHRNLLIEIYHKRGTPPARIDYFATRYFYDEAGNRIRKLTYKNNNESAGPVLDWNNTSNPGNSWTLYNNEHYARGVDGKDLATYTNNSLDVWYVWGTDMTGKIKGSTKYYFFKDHLGSVRAVVDNNFNLISATDYDAWGDKMQGRIYNGDSTKFGFTGKEEDEENLYVYFGARYYDSRIGRWVSIDPVMEKHYDFNPYNYTLDNPMIFVDPDGRQVFLGGESYQESKGSGQYFDVNESQEMSQKRFDNKRHRESGITTTDVGLLDPVEWLSGGIVTFSIRLSASLTKSATEKLVQQTLKGIGNTRVIKSFDIGSKWMFGSYKTEAKWLSQMSKRGWTGDQITEAVTKGKSFEAVNLINIGNAATRYVHPTTGQSVVIDDVTKEVIHLGGPGFKY